MHVPGAPLSRAYIWVPCLPAALVSRSAIEASSRNGVVYGSWKRRKRLRHIQGKESISVSPERSRNILAVTTIQPFTGILFFVEILFFLRWSGNLFPASEVIIAADRDVHGKAHELATMQAREVSSPLASCAIYCWTEVVSYFLYFFGMLFHMPAPLLNDASNQIGKPPS